MQRIGVAIIGTGQIALANHLPGLALCPAAKVISLCDNDPATLERARGQVDGVSQVTTDWNEVVRNDQVHAVIIATPNDTHPPIAIATAKAGKHVMCEKPIALNARDAIAMLRAAEQANVRHMTAFTYRFVPAMRYMKHLVARGDIGQPFHFRAQRFQDWAKRPLGWRQQKVRCGSGELADMLSHRIDYAHYLIGPIARLVADMRNFIPQRGGALSDVDDWVSIIAEFRSPGTTTPGQSAAPPRTAAAVTTAVLESTKLATGRGEGHHGQDAVEINGSEGTLVYSTQKPLQLQLGKPGDADLHTIEVPREFQVQPGSPRDPTQGDPLVTFRYDQSFEFIDAIQNRRPCTPSFQAGAMAQAVMDAAIQSAQTRAWVDVISTE